MDPSDIKREKYAALFKWGIGLVGAAVISPVVFLAVKGIIGLTLAAVTGFTVIQLAPVYSMKLANYKMKMIMKEASDNPIETMQNEYMQRSKELTEFDENITEFETEIGSFDDKLDGFKKDYAPESERFEQISVKMHEALKGMREERSQAQKDLVSYEKNIKKAQAIYTMSLAAQRVTKLSSTAQEQVYAKIKEEVAFDTVNKQLNRSFANLNTALQRRNDLKALMPA